MWWHNICRSSRRNIFFLRKLLSCSLRRTGNTGTWECYSVEWTHGKLRAAGRCEMRETHGVKRRESHQMAVVLFLEKRAQRMRFVRLPRGGKISMNSNCDKDTSICAPICSSYTWSMPDLSERSGVCPIGQRGSRKTEKAKSGRNSYSPRVDQRTRTADPVPDLPASWPLILCDDGGLQSAALAAPRTPTVLDAQDERTTRK